MAATSHRLALSRQGGAKGKADVLILTTVPSAAHWGTTAELAEAGRQAARDRNAGTADAEKAFVEAAGR